MKKLQTLALFVGSLLIGIASASATPRIWDFSNVPTTQVADWQNITTDGTGTWTTSSRSMYAYNKAISNQALKAKGSALAFVSGLTFTATAGTIEVGVGTEGYDYMQLSNGAQLTIPSLTAGDTILVTASLPSSATEVFSSQNASPVMVQPTTTMQCYTLIAAANGSVTITAPTNGVRIQRIEVKDLATSRISSNITVDSIYIGTNKNASTISMQIELANSCHVYFHSQNPHTDVAPIVITSTDTAVATLSQTGVLTPVGAGTTTITLTQNAAGCYNQHTISFTVQVIPTKQYYIARKDANKSYTVVQTADWIEQATFNTTSAYRLSDTMLAYVSYANHAEPAAVKTYAPTDCLDPEDGPNYTPTSLHGHHLVPIVSTKSSGNTMTFYLQHADSVEVYYIGAAADATKLTMNILKSDGTTTVRSMTGDDVQGANNLCQKIGYKFSNTDRYQLQLYAKDGDIAVYAIRIFPHAPITLTARNYSVSKTKTYDGTDYAKITSIGTFSGLVTTDDAKITAEAHYSQTAVGRGLTITITYHFDGVDTTRYNFATREVTIEDCTINAKQLSVTGTVVEPSKQYDATTSIDFEPGTLLDTVPGDDVQMVVTASYADANVGNNKTITINYSLTGSASGNYIAPAKSTSQKANITPLQLRVAGTTSQNKTYDGSTYAAVTAGTLLDTIPGDEVNLIASANFETAVAGNSIPVVVTYSITGAQSANYTAPINDTLSQDIQKRQLTAYGVAVQKVKMYDGTTTAAVTTQPTLSNVIPNDVLTATATAFYANAAIGKNKSITVKYTVSGARADCYIAPVQHTYCTDAKILESTDFIGDDNDKFYTDPDGFCQGQTGSILFTISQGDPTQYRLVFFNDAIEQGFVNVDWTPLTSLQDVPLYIPAQCKGGEYKVMITFRNEIYVETQPVVVSFIVNLPVSYLDQIFDDVVSVDNRENNFNTFQWYHNGQAIEGATLPYYQEIGGLTGSYYVALNQGTETAQRTCEVSSWRASKGSARIVANPNPATNTTHITLKGFDNSNHTLNLISSYATVMYSTTFAGNETTLNLQSLPRGIYVVEIDGVNAKLIKR